MHFEPLTFKKLNSNHLTFIDEEFRVISFDHLDYRRTHVCYYDHEIKENIRMVISEEDNNMRIDVASEFSDKIKYKENNLIRSSHVAIKLKELLKQEYLNHPEYRLLFLTDQIDITLSPMVTYNASKKRLKSLTLYRKHYAGDKYWESLRLFMAAASLIILILVYISKEEFTTIDFLSF